MEEDHARNVHSESHGNTSTSQTTDTKSPDPSSEQPLGPSSGEMEFVAMPPQHFGGYMSPLSHFDMTEMSNVLNTYPQQRYMQPQHMPHMSQSPMPESNLAYSSIPTQQFASQIAAQYAQSYAHNTAPQPRMYAGYTGGHGPDFQTRQPYYPQQQHYGYQNVPLQSSYAIMQGQQSATYGHMGHLPRPGAPYSSSHMPFENQNVSRTMQVGQAPHQMLRRNSSDSSLRASSVLRGPPRKPKQSGYALWVGNLPPGTQILDLKDHFARDAREDIESVFLISKSNCAFVNYKSEESCAAAMSRFHDSKFRGQRLVCRLRRGSNNAAAVQSTASAPTPPEDSSSMTKPSTSSQESTPKLPTTDFHALSDPVEISEQPLEITAKEKFFIMKSLTIEDLDRSLSTGTWATQMQNEENLNLAFRTAVNVYLIFSVNKSGEYYGYARMISPISAEAAPQTQEEKVSAKTLVTPHSGDTPLTITTPATMTAPAGYVIDDSARGTIFWEATVEASPTTATANEPDKEQDAVSGEESAKLDLLPQPTSFGKPFKIAWQSTERLSFVRTRGLRNPWNANREIKIARDGTEVEPTVGRRLINMFEQQAQMNALARSSGSLTQFGYQQQQQQQQQAGAMSQASYGYGIQPNLPYGRPY